MFKFVNVAVVFILALSVGLPAAIAQDAKLSAQDKTFMKEAASGGKMEVLLGEMASKKAENPDVKEFGERMVQDHSQANKKLENIAKEHNLALPDELDKKHKEMVEKLNSLSGKEFDRQYMSEMVKDHNKDVDAFKKQAQQGQNPALKQFASETVKKLEEHKKLAKNVNQKLQARAK